MTSVSQGFTSFAQTYENNEDLYKFADDLLEVIRENTVEDDQPESKDVVSAAVLTVDKFLNNLNSSISIYDNLPDDAFQTKRLVVKSEGLTDYQGAVECVSGYNDLYVLQYDDQLSTKKAYEYYLNCDCVEYVEPDIICSAEEDVPGDEIPDDEAGEYDEITAAAIQWLSDKIGFSDIKDELSKRIQDEYVLVAVLDSGIDTDHELFVDRLVESDVNLSSSGSRDSVEDDYGHGTHVSGIIANNTLSNVKIKPYKILNDVGNGSLSTIALAVDMAVADGADIINMSLSADGESLTLTNSIDNAVANDVNVVVAAGNKNIDLSKKYISPACVKSAITVSATDKDDKLAYFSNYNGTIDIAAPGVDIESSYLDNKYLKMSGTSMAAPQVTAGLAIVQTLFKDISASECEEMVKEYAINIREKDTNYFGSGLLYLRYILVEKPVTAEPVFSVDSCTFSDAFELELSCPDSDATIYYIVMDRTNSAYGDMIDKLGVDLEDIFNENQGILNLFEQLVYTGPITISVDSKVVAYAEEKGRSASSIVSKEYDRVEDNIEDYYDINVLGYITAYYGSDTDIVIPDKVNGKTVKGIASRCFENNIKLHTVVLPATAKKISGKAFSGCLSLESVTGTGVEQIEANAFENSLIETVDFPNLKKIGKYAFSNCVNLSSITINKVESIENYAFKCTLALEELNCDSLVSIGTNSFELSGIKSIVAPKVTSIGTNAFADCYDLESASFPQLTELSIGAFKNCTSLSALSAPLLTTIGANALRNVAIDEFFGRYVETIGNYAFADNPYLVSAILPVATSSGTNAFLNCTALQVVMLPAMEYLNNNSFLNCSSLVMLYLPGTKTVAKGAFDGTSIEFLKFSIVEKIESLPSTLQGILLPDTLTSITAKTPSTDFVVYGYEDSYAELYATTNSKEFKTIPAIVYESTDKVNPDEKYIAVYALGFNCEYQWYKNDTVSNVGGIPIDGATYFYYEPTEEDNATAYYCVITCRNESNVNSVVTNPIENSPEYIDADYTEYYKFIDGIASISRDYYGEDAFRELDLLMKIDILGLKASDQETIDLHVATLKKTLKNIVGTVMGDLDGNGSVSAIDARVALQYSVEDCELSYTQLLAGDVNGDGEVTALDARRMLQMSVE